MSWVQDLDWHDGVCLVRATLVNVGWSCSNHSMLPKDAQLKSVPRGGNFSTSLERTFLPSIGAALGQAVQPRGSDLSGQSKRQRPNICKAD